MGFFDKIFGKGKKDKPAAENNGTMAEEKTTEDTDESISSEDISAEAAAEAVPAEENGKSPADEDNGKGNDKQSESSAKKNVTGEKVTAAVEMFPVKKDSVTPQRNAEICTRFINNALSMGEELKAENLQGLNYSELCLLYNNMQMMTLKLDPKIKAIAGVVIENNLKVVRAGIIGSLKKMTVYVLYTRVNSLPFSNQSALFIYTYKELAEAQLAKSDLKFLGIKEVKPEQLEMHFDVFYMAGFREIIIDMGTKIPLTQLYKPKEAAVYGIINPVVCNRMIFFNQMTASFGDKAKAESRSVTEEENKQINRVWADITEGLIRSTLLVPAEKAEEEGKIKIKSVSVKAPDGKKWIALFTDQVALNTFFKSSQSAAGIKNPILSQFEMIKNDSSVEGIIINPGRESFRIPSKVLASRKEIKMPEKAPDADGDNK